MIVKVFGIYDSKAEAYLQPFFMKSAGEAIRAITDLVNDDKHNFGKYSADYTLFQLGSFDDATAKFDMLLTPHSLGVLLEFKRGSHVQA
nr:MAG: nonstructural protein [Microviridae sp.]